MPYLQKFDYKTYIQGDYLRQLTQADDTKRTIEEGVSMDAISQRLTQKYDLDLEFRNLTVWDRNKTYGAWDRVYIDMSENGFNTWVALTVYDVGEPVFYNNKGYYCTVPNTDATFIVAHWELAGSKYDIFHAAFPDTCTLNGIANPSTLTNPYAPVFNYKNLYSKDDVVFWKGNTYVCNRASSTTSHQAALQNDTITNQPYDNIFPNDPVNNNNEQFWKDATVYTIEAGTRLTNSAWVLGDNRNQAIRDAMIRITVFKLSPLIAPMNRPDVWLDDYRECLRVMNEAARGEITFNLPLKQPHNAIRFWGTSWVKNINNY